MMLLVCRLVQCGCVLFLCVVLFRVSVVLDGVFCLWIWWDLMMLYFYFDRVVVVCFISLFSMVMFKLKLEVYISGMWLVVVISVWCCDLLMLVVFEIRLVLCFMYSVRIGLKLFGRLKLIVMLNGGVLDSLVLVKCGMLLIMCCVGVWLVIVVMICRWEVLVVSWSRVWFICLEVLWMSK